MLEVRAQGGKGGVGVESVRMMRVAVWGANTCRLVWVRACHELVRV